MPNIVTGGAPDEACKYAQKWGILSESAPGRGLEHCCLPYKPDKIVIKRQDWPEQSRVDYIIRPNRAMSWKSLLVVYLVISSVTIAIGVMFYLQGLTLILPWSGLDILLLGIAFYLCAWRGGVQEVLSITENRIVFERGRQKPDTHREFQRAWVKVILERSWNSWYPSRLLLRSHGHQLEIGRFLNEQERQGLAQEIQRTLIARKEQE